VSGLAAIQVGEELARKKEKNLEVAVRCSDRVKV
jgi:hypothetical protein